MKPPKKRYTLSLTMREVSQLMASWAQCGDQSEEMPTLTKKLSRLTERALKK